MKLYVYGYLNRVQSSRRLERETQRNVELMWLTSRLMPDFKTIADFRKNNGKAIRAPVAGQSSAAAVKPVRLIQGSIPAQPMSMLLHCADATRLQGYAGGRAPTVGALGDARAVAEGLDWAWRHEF